MKKVVLLIMVIGIIGTSVFSFGFFEDMELFFAKMKYNSSWTFHESSSNESSKLIEKEFNLGNRQDIKLFIMAKTKKDILEVRLLDSENNLIFEESDNKIYEKEKYNLDSGFYKIEILIKNSKEAHIFVGIDGKIDKIKKDDI
ncbi:MAG: hypothetical protein ACQESN_07580 [Thermotogota bacterium]